MVLLIFFFLKNQSYPISPIGSLSIDQTLIGLNLKIARFTAHQVVEHCSKICTPFSDVESPVAAMMREVPMQPVE